MTAEELRDNLVSVIIAGHETTASAVAWAMQLLAHNPHVQDPLAAEIDDGKSDVYGRRRWNEVAAPPAGVLVRGAQGSHSADRDRRLDPTTH